MHQGMGPIRTRPQRVAQEAQGFARKGGLVALQVDDEGGGDAVEVFPDAVGAVGGFAGHNFGQLTQIFATGGVTCGFLNSSLHGAFCSKYCAAVPRRFIITSRDLSVMETKLCEVPFAPRASR